MEHGEEKPYRFLLVLLECLLLGHSLSGLRYQAVKSPSHLERLKDVKAALKIFSLKIKPLTLIMTNSTCSVKLAVREFLTSNQLCTFGVVEFTSLPQALPLEDEIRSLTRITCGDQNLSSTGTESLKCLGENKLQSGNEQRTRTKSPRLWAVLELVMI